MVWVILRYSRRFVISHLLQKYPNKSFISLDRLELALLIDMNYVRMVITIDVYKHREVNKFNSHYIFLNLNISVKYEGYLMTMGGHVV